MRSHLRWMLILLLPLVLAACGTADTGGSAASSGDQSTAAAPAGSASASSDQSTTIVAVTTIADTAAPASTPVAAAEPAAPTQPESAVTVIAPVSSGSSVAGTPGQPVNTGPSPTPLQGPQTITLADDGQTLQLHTGDRFTLQLGESYNWMPQVANPTIVRRLPQYAMIRGAQGIYQAMAPGTTRLAANGSAKCIQGQMCSMLVRLFRLTIVVS